jgi:SAM-dependent methyltransferase
VVKERAEICGQRFDRPTPTGPHAAMPPLRRAGLETGRVNRRVSRPPTTDTRDDTYTERLQKLESVWWKRLLDVQAPYRRNLKRLDLGFTLDVGCGVGRNLINLGGHGVGVDHNPASIAEASSRGLLAYTPEEFGTSEYAVPGRFDSMLVAHVVEHMEPDDAISLLRTYLPYLRPGGRIVVICPQPAGYRSDTTHVRYLDDAAMRELLTTVGTVPERSYSFPFPKAFGRVFKYNETVAVARLPAER